MKRKRETERERERERGRGRGREEREKIHISETFSAQRHTRIATFWQYAHISE